MEKTRNLFILNGKTSDVNLVLNQLHFKGLTTFMSQTVTVNDVLSEFSNNKSVVCSNIPDGLDNTSLPILVKVINDNISENQDVINVNANNISEQFQTLAKSHNCDIGDHKSDSSGLNGAPSAKDCPYCIYINDNFSDTKDGANRTTYKSPNFFVMPTIGEFITGYLLIIPNQHIMSLAELDPALTDEFIEVLNDIQFILKLTYHRDLLIWENGTGNGGIGKAKSSIVHSHIHIAPSQLTAEKIQKISGFPLTKISYQDLSSYGQHSYLLVNGDSNNEWYINDNPDLYIPRQYVRQLLAEEYGLAGEMWNWRTHPFMELIKRTNEEITNALKFNWNFIPERIKKRTLDYLIY